MIIDKNAKRTLPIEQDPKVRAHNFDEVCSGFTAEMAITEAQRCLHCKNPKCVAGCPVNVKIPDFIAYCAEGQFDMAAKVIKTSNNLPSICGRVCPQEEQCEKNCVRINNLGGAVSIGQLERFCADYALNKGLKPDSVKPQNGLRVAVVGSGPAGLSCSAELAKEGYEVNVFEAFHKPGGVLVYGIPEFRLPKKLVQTEIDSLKELGVVFKMNTIIGKTFTLEELLQTYNAVFIGTGAGLPTFMKIKGENLAGVYSANEYLTRVNLMKAYTGLTDTPIVTGKNVVVVGGGNVAMDAARTALRMGADSVKIVYRRSMDEIPARKEEVHHAIDEGIEFLVLTNPVEILGDKKVEGMKVVKMELGEKDEKGRAKPIEIKGSDYTLDCDQVIIAIGTSPNPLLAKSASDLEVSNRGTIIVNEDGKTSIENVYAGGDAVVGAATVILAMGAGKLAAKSIITKFTNKY